jgi:mannose-6-phosphate isomerase-like protein (cupin superfamily)
VAAWLTEPLAECAGGRLSRAVVAGEASGRAATAEFHYVAAGTGEPHLRPGRCLGVAAGEPFRYRAQSQGLTLIVAAALAGTEAAGACDVGDEPMVLAPDGSQIRPLLGSATASVVHCTLPPGAVTEAVRHRTVEETWYVLSGQGELWREAGAVTLRPGVATAIPLPGPFQFRAAPGEPLVILIATFPAWPGPQEAEAARGPW